MHLPRDAACAQDQRPWRWFAFVLFAVVLPSTALAAPDLTGKIDVGTAYSTEHKPQSKLWFNDGTWWAILFDGNHQRIWRFENGNFVKQTYADAVIDDRSTSRADVVWDGTFLYVLMWHSTSPHFSKYSYDAATRTYTRLPGFPVTLPISGTEVMVLDRDSTGRLWASFENGHEIHVIWTTTPDHLSWNTTGMVLESNVDSDDISTTVAFGGNQIGVFWSDQISWRFGFRVHRDTDSPEIWQPRESVDYGSAIDDHVNAACDASGRVYVATKDLYNRIHVYMRDPGGLWTMIGNNVSGGTATRPIIMVDAADNLLRVFYTDWEISPNPIHMVTAPLSTGIFGSPVPYLTSSSGSFLNDATGTKQILSMGSGVMAMASTSASAYWGLTNQDTTPPDVDPLDPPDGAAGVPVDAVVRALVTDTGVGVDASSIVMQLDGASVPFTLSGSSAAYTISWTPDPPLQSGRIYTLYVSARDNAYPPLSDAETFQFKTAFAPGPFSRQINFQPQSTVPPSGYEADWGAKYTLTRGSGWDKGTVSGKQADVNADLRLDTYVDRNNSWGEATWNYDAPNGLYRVTLVAGSPISDGKHGATLESAVLLNGQTTTANSYITISDYQVAVTDGQMTLTMGGIGGTKKTQLCYFTFDYVGPVPPPPSESETVPARVAGLQMNASGSDLVLTWDPVTHDIDGATISVARYGIYGGTTPGFTPDRTQKTNRIGLVAGTTFTDLNALGVAQDRYYYVTAEQAGGTESTQNSDLGVRRRVSLTPRSGQTLVTWISLPARTSITTAAELAAEIQGGAGAGGLLRLARFERESQQRSVYEWDVDKWAGENFPLLAGEAYEVTVTAPLGWNVIGVEESPATMQFSHHTSVSNLNWIGLPTRVTYTNAKQLAESLNGGSGAARVAKVARLNPTNGAIESYLYYGGAWRGTNFSLDVGVGVAVVVATDISNWTPAVP